MSFVHLHVHSEYSLLESAAEIKSLVKKAAEFGQPALTLTDHGNMYGAIEFYFACRDHKIKPIIGLDIFVAPGSRFDKPQGLKYDQLKNPGQLVLLAKSYRGYQTLCELSTRSYFEGFYYRPRVDLELLESFHEDIICLTGGLRGLIYDQFVRSGPETAAHNLIKLQEIFKDNLYCEFTRTGKPQEKAFEDFLLSQAKARGVACLATQDVHYVNQGDALAQDVLFCIGNNLLLKDPHRYKMPGDQFYLKSTEEMAKVFSDHPEWLRQSVEIASQIDIQFRLKDSNGKPIYHLPSFPTPEGMGLDEFIRSEVLRGLDERIREIKGRDEEWSEEIHKKYLSRIDYELGIISNMGFNGYFLIVSDFIRWAKSQNIPVGPGRGSGAGSLVAFCLKITDLDPMPYNLLFERFLNPERISMPDFDIDFCQDRRGEVIQYVTQKYSSESVSQIITYGKLQAKAAIKDVGRILGMSFAEVDRVTKLVPEKLGITIQEAIDQEPRLRDLMEDDPMVQNLIDLALKIEGLVRHAGIHAAGVIIANGRIRDLAPLAKGSNDEVVVQYDMKHSEKIGLIKFDFLGLKTLTHINSTLRMIEANRGKKLTLADISLHDPGIYEIMSQGDTLGIFQFEGEGITDAIRKIRPSNFFDITAINALYRPGPMAMIPIFARRKHGEEPVEYIFDELKAVLEETFGIIVYQEQVMAIAALIAGYSLGEADMLRRAMGKKIKEEMDQHRIRFLKGAKERGFEENKSEELFELMYKFADYGFNKSHAAAYCVIAAQTAWLKRYYPVEFYAGLLSTELSNTDKIVQYSKDAQKHGIVIEPPNINESEYLFTPRGDKIYFGLGAIKGVGEGVINDIVKVRNTLPDRKFKDLKQFFESVDPKALNKKTLESLIKAGALDIFGYHRAQLMLGFPKLVEWATQKFKSKSIGQHSLFEMIDEDVDKISLTEFPEWTRTEALKQEKEVLGFYLSDHPLKGFENLISAWVTCSLSELPKIHSVWQKSPAHSNHKQKYDFRNRDGNKKKVFVAGLIREMRELVTKKGTRMAFAKLEDLTGDVPLIIFPDVYATSKTLLTSDKPILVNGFLESESDSLKIIVESLVLLDDVFSKTRKIKFMLHLLSEEQIQALHSILLNSSAGQVPCEFYFQDDEKEALVEIIPESKFEVEFKPELIETLQAKIGSTQFLELQI
jgi:DNA polymerase-3 subunit alpha